MFDEIELNVPLLRRRVPNLTVAAKGVGLRPATVSNLTSGKIPLARAEVRTLVALATLAGCSLDELVVRGAGTAMIETGMKVLDLFAPLVRGGTAGLVSRPGLGQMVLLGELLERMKRRGFATFVWLSRPDPHLTDLALAAHGSGATLAEAHKGIATLRGEHDVIVATDRAAVLSGELFTLRERLQEAGARPVTYALVDTAGEAPDEELPFGPLDALWQFDTDRFARGILPAIDPVASTSTLLEGAQLESIHLTVQQRARRLLRRYREWHGLVRVRGIEKLPASELLNYHRGERLEAFLSQTAYVAEAYTKLPGTWLSVQETVEDVRRILDGAADELPVDSLKLISRLP